MKAITCSYAHIPGGGPPGKHCDQCAYFKPMKNHSARYCCEKILSLKPGAIAGQIKVKRACKYFEGKQP